jgi:hypothetical protein
MTGDKLWMGLVVGLLVATGCSDDSEPQTTSGGGSGGTTTSGGGGEGGLGGQGGDTTLTIVVQQWDGTPIEGAGVALDVGDSDRLEATSDGEGEVIFTGFDMASLVSVIAHKDGWTYAAASAAYVAENVDVESEPVELFVGEIDPTFVTVSGTATNMVDEGHRLDITTHPVADNHRAVGPNWSVGVLPNKPFTLFAVEYIWDGALPQGGAQTFVAWDQVDSPGVSSDDTMALDFGGTTTTQTLSGSFAKPTNESLAVGGEAYVRTTTYDHGLGAFLGASTAIQVSQDDTAFDYDVEWIEIEGHSMVTSYSIRTRTPSDAIKEFSSVTVDGPPTGGSQDLGLHNPPEITLANFIDSPITWTPAGGETYDFQFLHVKANNTPQGHYRVGAAETEATIPALPSTSDPSQIFQGSMRVFVGNCTGPRHRDVCDKRSYGSSTIL